MRNIETIYKGIIIESAKVGVDERRRETIQDSCGFLPGTGQPQKAADHQSAQERRDVSEVNVLLHGNTQGQSLPTPLVNAPEANSGNPKGRGECLLSYNQSQNCTGLRNNQRSLAGTTSGRRKIGAKSDSRIWKYILKKEGRENMSKTLSLVIWTTPYTFQNTSTTIKITRAALGKGYKVNLFASGDGVYNFTRG